MRHRRSALVLATLLLVAGLVDAPGAAATDPSPVTIPPLRADGPITLPNGRVLPVMPRGVQQSSMQAEMLALHAADRITFTPGARPEPRGGASADLTLDLTQPSGSASL